MKNNAIDVRVVVNPMAGSLAAPDARYDVILYYSKAGEDNFNSAPGVFGDVATEAAYFTRKCVNSSVKDVTFYDFKTREFHSVMTDRRNNLSTLFFCGQFASEDDVLSFLNTLHFGANNLDIRGRVKLVLDGACKDVIKQASETWKRLDEVKAESFI